MKSLHFTRFVASLENRYGSLGSSRVQIPPPPSLRREPRSRGGFARLAKPRRRRAQDYEVPALHHIRRESRKPLRAVTSVEGSNPSPSAFASWNRAVEPVGPAMKPRAKRRPNGEGKVLHMAGFMRSLAAVRVPWFLTVRSSAALPLISGIQPESNQRWRAGAVASKALTEMNTLATDTMRADVRKHSIARRSRGHRSIGTSQVV